jgi:toxin-antitoxin system PIN domain toxin
VFAVDTNILVYAADRASPFHEPCRGSLSAWRSRPDAWFLTWNVVYEFLRVVTHPRVMPRPWTAPDAWTFVEALLEAPGLTMLAATERHAGVAADVMAEMPWLSGNLLHDAQTAILLREHGVRRIYTRDADFHRFRFLEAIDPVALPS